MNEEMQLRLHNLSNNSKKFIKIIFLTHFILSIWGSQPAGFLPISYVYLHLIISVCGLLAIAKPEASQILSLYGWLLGISIVLDIIFLSIYHPRAYMIYEENRNVNLSHLNEFRFCLGMCILNLLLKPVSCILLFAFSYNTTENDDAHAPFLPFTGFTGGPNRGLYDDMDRHEESQRVETVKENTR